MSKLAKLESLDVIQERIDSLKEWLNENGQNCVAEQAHLNRGSAERLYWHYGYLIALCDAVSLLKARRE